MSVSRRIEESPERVFEVFTDLEHAAERIDGIRKLEVLTDGEVGVGTRFRETRIMFKREAAEEMEITAFEPGRSYTVGCDSCGARWSSVYRFVPDGAGTIVDLDVTVQPRSFMAKLTAPLARLFAGTVRKCLEQDMDDLKASIESQPAGMHTPA